MLLAFSYAESGLRADQTYDRLLRSAALSMLERVQMRPDETGDPRLWVDLPAAAFDTLAFAPDDRVFYRVHSRAGEELTGNPRLPMPKRTMSSEPYLYTATWSGEPVRFLVQSRALLTEQGEIWVTLQLGQTRLARDADALRAFGWSALTLTAVAVLCLALVPLAARRALAPLRGLSHDLEARHPDDLGPLDGPSPREVAGLVKALNGFMSRLTAMQRRSERFIADVAHQMRTGINAVDAEVQMASEAASLADVRERLARARSQSARTMRLTNQLLSHAMVIHRAEAQPAQALDLRALVREVLVEVLAAPQFAAMDLSFEDALPEPAPTILGDPVSLREALRNLLENAVQHGGANVGVTVTLALVSADSIALRVSDTGPGLAEEERLRVLERFRASGATGGSGLGLAIVAEVAQAHDAELTIDTAASGGLAVTVTFPGASPAPQGGPSRRDALLLLAAAPLVLGAALPGAARADATLTIWSATDAQIIAPILDAFRDAHPDISFRYRDFDTQALYSAVLASGPGGAAPDVVISPALDLQVQLVNEGLARPLPRRAVQAESAANWRGELFGFTLEPEVIVLNPAAFAALPRPRSHAGLADLIRDNPAVFAGRLGTYDIRRSGIGYLLSAQAATLGPDHARLTEIMGHTGTQLFETTADMVRAVAEGEILLATGVLGSYAAALVSADERAEILLLEDYNLAVPRTAFISRDATQPEAAARFIEFLLAPAGQAALARAPGLAPLTGPDWLSSTERASLLTLQPGPGMLLWQDRMKRQGFLADWVRSITP
nr:extracellular solute-binding protein [Alloyangia pacifica]